MGAAHSRTGVKLKRNDVEKMQGDATAVQTVDTAASRSERPPWAQRPVFVSGQTDDRFQSISDRLNKMAPELRPSVIYNVFFKDTNDDLISGFLVAIK